MLVGEGMWTIVFSMLWRPYASLRGFVATKGENEEYVCLILTILFSSVNDYVVCSLFFQAEQLLFCSMPLTVWLSSVQFKHNNSADTYLQIITLIVSSLVFQRVKQAVTYFVSWLSWQWCFQPSVWSSHYYKLPFHFDIKVGKAQV